MSRKTTQGKGSGFQGIHSVYSITAHPFGGLVLQVFFGQFGLVDAGIWLLTQNFEGLSCWYIFWAGEYFLGLNLSSTKYSLSRHPIYHFWILVWVKEVWVAAFF